MGQPRVKCLVNWPEAQNERDAKIAQLIEIMRSTYSTVAGSQTLKIYLISPAPPAHPIQQYPAAPIPSTLPRQRRSCDHGSWNSTLKAHLYRLQTHTLSSQTST
ncbi:hypothetical protein FIBSPDRAFT_1054505 [Athelia psychrophila]|uniref:Uncharacterized protein n=1 Tax=Athelia psychrophila TaxID=1759441 RepID=A0A167V6U8_9AGAM|nr:hypothetical protein FIBSPDRAFT_1054505 [Fibularhizoctonia sp. CBS 109695]